jgi:hypothetical protein
MKQSLLIAAIIALAATACSEKNATPVAGKSSSTTGSSASAASTAPKVAPAPPKPAGGDQAPDLTPEMLKAIQADLAKKAEEKPAAKPAK